MKGKNRILWNLWRLLSTNRRHVSDDKLNILMEQSPSMKFYPRDGKGEWPRIQNRNNSLELEVRPEPKQPGEKNSMAWKTKPKLLQPKDEKKQNLITLGLATFPATSCIVFVASSLGFIVVHLSPSFILQNVVDALAHRPGGASSFLRSRIIPRWTFT